MAAEDLAKRYAPQELKTFEHQRQLWESRFTPCGQFVIAGGYDGGVHRWKVVEDKLEPLPSLKGHNGWVQCLDFLPAGESVITTDSWGGVSCWKYSEAEESKPLWTRPDVLKGWIRAIDVSPDGSLIAVGGSDSVVRILAAKDGALVKELPAASEVFSLAFHPNGKQLLTGDLKAVLRSWDIASGAMVKELTVDGLYVLNHMQECGGIRRLIFDATGTRLVIGGMKAPEGGFAKGAPVVVLVDWEAGKVVRQVLAGTDQDGFIYDLQFHPDGFVMGAASAFPGQGKMFFWRPEDDAVFLTGKHTNGRSVSLHPDKKRLLFLMSVAPNGNGRGKEKDGTYFGGTAKMFLLAFPDAPTA